MRKLSISKRRLNAVGALYDSIVSLKVTNNRFKKLKIKKR
tara:strand:+ start:214 stop:333 length:120 start_codon:yes stop_codon:yes gene_type:complete